MDSLEWLNRTKDDLGRILDEVYAKMPKAHQLAARFSSTSELYLPLKNFRDSLERTIDYAGCISGNHIRDLDERE